jgi:predicted RNase H-like HicB family nuclease
MRDELKFTLEIEQEEDGRWIGAIPEIPGALVYGRTQEEAIALVRTLALQVVGEADPDNQETSKGLNHEK